MEYKVEIIRSASLGMVWVNATSPAQAAEFATAYGKQHGWRGFSIGKIAVA